MFTINTKQLSRHLNLSAKSRFFCSSAARKQSSSSSAIFSVGVITTLTCIFAYNNKNKSTLCAGGDVGALGRYSIINAVAKASPAVVSIEAKIADNHVVGSGFIVSKEGFIVTCAHVVDGLSDNVTLITMKTGQKLLAHLWRLDRDTDTAVLKIEDVPDNLPVVSFNASHTVKTGDFVIAIGTPHGLTDSVSLGTVTNLGVSPELGTAGRGYRMIQTDAVIYPGNSGGPLLNINGDVVGINSCKSLTTFMYGYALPSDLAAVVTDKMIRKKRVVIAYVGMNIGDDYLYNFAKNLTVESRALHTSNVSVLEVAWGSPASKAGFKKRDVILEIDGQPVVDRRTLVDKFNAGIGQEFTVKVWRRKYYGDEYSEEELNLKITPDKSSKNNQSVISGW